MRNRNGQFTKGTSGNPSGRPANAEAVRKLLEPRREELVTKAVELALDGDSIALKLCLDRISSPLKSELSLVVIPGFESAFTIMEKANLIIQSIAEGRISIESGERLLTALTTYNKIYELYELEKRIQKLEKCVK